MFDNAKKLLRQRGALHGAIALVPVDHLGKALFEKIEREILFRLEVIEQRAFRDAGLFGDRLGGSAIKPFLREQIERCPQNGSPGVLLVLDAFSAPFWRRRSSAFPFLFSLHIKT